MRTLLDAVKKAETGNLLYGFEFDYAGNGSDRAWSIKSRNKDAPSVLSPYSQQTVLYVTAKYKIIAVCGLFSAYSDCFLCRVVRIEVSRNQ